MTSLPEPVVNQLAAVEPVTVSAVVQGGRIEVLEIRDSDGVAGRLVGARRHREVDRRDRAPAATVSVSVPTPPSIDVSVPR